MGKELAPKAHVQVKFCADPVRSEDNFPEWKPALAQIQELNVLKKVCISFRGPKVWNSLSEQARNSEPLSIFNAKGGFPFSAKCRAIDV